MTCHSRFFEMDCQLDDGILPKSDLYWLQLESGRRKHSWHILLPVTMSIAPC